MPADATTSTENKRRMGRPPKPKAERVVPVHLMLTLDEQRKVQAAAADADLTPSDWVKARALREQQEPVRLTWRELTSDENIADRRRLRLELLERDREPAGRRSTVSGDVRDIRTTIYLHGAEAEKVDALCRQWALSRSDLLRRVALGVPLQAWEAHHSAARQARRVEVMLRSGVAVRA